MRGDVRVRPLGGELVGEGDVLEPDLAADVQQLDRVRRVGHGARRVQEAVDALGRGHRGLHDVVLLRELEDRPEELLHELPEGEERPHRELPLEDQVAAGGEQSGAGRRPREVDGRLEGAHGPDRALVGAVEVRVEVVERAERGRLSGEELDHRHAGERLVEVGVHAGKTDADRPEGLAHDPAEVRGQPDDHRERQERHEREPPVEDEHGGRDPDDHEDVAEYRDDPAAHHLGERVDIVRDPRHEPPDRIPVEEGERQELQVAEQLEAQVVHRALADHRRDEALRISREGVDEEDEEVQRP